MKGFYLLLYSIALRTLLLSPLFNTGTYNFFVITTPILGKVLSMYRNAPELKKLLKLCRKLTSLHGLNNLVLHNYGNIYKKIFFFNYESYKKR